MRPADYLRLAVPGGCDLMEFTPLDAGFRRIGAMGDLATISLWDVAEGNGHPEDPRGNDPPMLALQVGPNGWVAEAGDPNSGWDDFGFEGADPVVAMIGACRHRLTAPFISVPCVGREAAALQAIIDRLEGLL